MNHENIPFGMLFAESPEVSIEQVKTPVYDPKEGISFIVDDFGKHIPFIEAFQTSMLATQTDTFVAREGTDTDPTPTTTPTVTKVRAEATDTD